MSAERQPSDQLIFDCGFPDWVDVSTRHSVADLFRSKRARSGVYVLGFADGERYVGLTTNVVRRFAQHRKRHTDITHLTFRRVARADQQRTEREFIHALERGGVPLRNRAEMSVIEGERDLDELIPADEQTRWLRQGFTEPDTSGRVEDVDLRRRYRGQLALLESEPAGAATVRLLSRYIPLALPRPRATELVFWSLSCLPSGSKVRMLARMSRNMQEVLGLFQEQGALVAAFQLAESPFVEAYGPRWRSQVEARGYETEDFRYRSAGHDQFRMYAQGERNAVELLEWDVARQAARQLNLNLLRKGPSYWTRNHCFELADAAYAAGE